MLKAIELPNCAYVGAWRDNERCSRIVIERPTNTGIRVAVPIDLWAEIKGAREYIYAVSENRIGFASGAIDGIREQLSDNCHGIREVTEAGRKAEITSSNSISDVRDGCAVE